MRVGSLFAGIGGLELGLERAGMEVVWQVENDPYCVKVLEKQWPEMRRYGDIKQIDWREVETPDLVCGGFPCQPVSVAGKRLGEEDERWLWPEFRRCVRELRPAHVLVENVPGLLTNGGAGVLGDLAALGYDAEWESLPAAALGAPHLRYRVFIVAYAGSQDLQNQPRRRSGQGRSGETIAGNDGSEGSVADASQHGRGEGRSEPAWQQGRPDAALGGSQMANTEVFAKRPGLCETEQGRLGWRRSGDGDWWAVEPDVGRVAHGVPSRVDRLRALGNAVVPQVSEWIGRRIMEAS